MGKQKQGQKAPYKMKVNVQFNNVYHTVEVDKKWKVSDMITYLVNKKQKSKKNTTSDSNSSTSSFQKSVSTTSDSGNETEQWQYYSLMTSDKCFELNSDYYCKDLMQKNDFLHLVQRTELEEEVKQQQEKYQEEEKQLEKQLENIQLNEKPLESTETLQDNQNKDENSPFEKLEIERQSSSQSQYKKSKKLSQQFELEDWEVMADKSKKNTLENINENQDNSEDYETYEEEIQAKEILNLEDKQNNLQIKNQEQDFSKKNNIKKLSKENEEAKNQI